MTTTPTPSPTLVLRDRQALRAALHTEIDRLAAEPEPHAAETVSDLGDLRSLLTLVDDTDSSVGVCSHCAGFIGLERILALPHATQCMPCASRHTAF